ncbi:metallophosphoesterase family protein [Labrys monachus]|uniref:DNA repair exonuclease SbcCD nuclease subunit n=1 Tax=Labrys monachus TaxID=217067 RepID=A0ABU0FPW3_9HYPH|nr:DNA repair exonuclease [Labrys monachus]MDQ0396149.1 DNA repair exonuclease SbcCD nuclease subunit [Labrys monachus]
MRFRFIHAADLHLDSPMHGLTARQPHLASLFADAARNAFVALVSEAIERDAAFLIIAGDVYDGDWRDYHTGLFFAGQLARLTRAGIPAYLIRGNHDADSIISRSLTLPADVHLFGTRKAETVELPALKVALHGRSFAERAVSENMVRSYPQAVPGWFNIGVLHTSLDGRAGHASYAPCTLADLRAKQYDYWALGHIHAAEIVCEDPYVVFPGNLQGRHIRETGAKGAMLVEVEDGAIVGVEPLTLDRARWAHIRVDVGAAASLDEVVRRVEPALRREALAAGERPLALRLTLDGETPVHHGLAASGPHVQAELQAAADRVSDRLYVERVVLATTPPRTEPADAGIGFADPEALLSGVEGEPGFAAAFAAAFEDIAARLPDELRPLLAEGGEEARSGLLDEARSIALGRLRQGRGSGGEPGA